jgi:hypothetical protein
MTTPEPTQSNAASTRCQIHGPHHALRPDTYEYRARECGNGWWWVEWRYAAAPGAWEVVVRVFGERRAEIVRDALSEEANERV